MVWSYGEVELIEKLDYVKFNLILQGENKSLQSELESSKVLKNLGEKEIKVISKVELGYLDKQKDCKEVKF